MGPVAQGGLNVCWSFRLLVRQHGFASVRTVRSHVVSGAVERLFRPYRAMRYSSKRRLAIACRPSVCNVGGSGSHRLVILETNCTDN